MAGITLQRWEYYFRASTILGIVGFGGIGFHLMVNRTGYAIVSNFQLEWRPHEEDDEQILT